MHSQIRAIFLRIFLIRYYIVTKRVFLYSYGYRYPTRATLKEADQRSHERLK